MTEYPGDGGWRRGALPYLAFVGTPGLFQVPSPTSFPEVGPSPMRPIPMRPSPPITFPFRGRPGIGAGAYAAAAAAGLTLGLIRHMLDAIEEMDRTGWALIPMWSYDTIVWQCQAAVRPTTERYFPQDCGVIRETIDLPDQHFPSLRIDWTTAPTLEPSGRWRFAPAARVDNPYGWPYRPILADPIPAVIMPSFLPPVAPHPQPSPWLVYHWGPRPNVDDGHDAGPKPREEEPLPEPVPQPVPEPWAKLAQDTGHKLAPPPRLTREKKGRWTNLGRWLVSIVGQLSEVTDLIDAAFDALPPMFKRRSLSQAERTAYFNGVIVRGGRWINRDDYFMNPRMKAERVLEHWEAIDLNEFAKNLLSNQIEDFLGSFAGRGSGEIKKRLNLPEGLSVLPSL